MKKLWPSVLRDTLCKPPLFRHTRPHEGMPILTKPVGDSLWGKQLNMSQVQYVLSETSGDKFTMFKVGKTAWFELSD